MMSIRMLGMLNIPCAPGFANDLTFHSDIILSSELSEAPVTDDDWAEPVDLDDDLLLATPPASSLARVSGRVVESSDDEATVSYSRSPVKNKRGRMEQLANERQKKRRL
jgi:hypothetical protein